MRVAATRASYTKGTVAIVYATETSPYIGGYRFDALDASSPWKAKYSNPSPAPSVSGLWERGAAVAVSPNNSHVVYGGRGSSSLSIYPFDFIDGFGSGLTKSESLTGEFTDITGLSFSQDESKLVVSTEDTSGNASSGGTAYLSAHEWSSSSSGANVVGSRLWATQTPFLPFAQTNAQDFTSVMLYQYPALQSGADETVFVTASWYPLVSAFQAVYTFDLDTGTQLGGSSVGVMDQASSAIGRLEQPIAISPIESTYNGITANTTAMIGHYNGNSYLNIGYAEDGSITSPVGRNALSPVYSASDTAMYCMFDPYGRFILAQSDAPYIRIYEQSITTGAFSLLDTYPTWAGGTINSLAYDKDQDVLFVASQSAPYITAFRMSKSGFDLKYPDMTPSIANAGGSVIRMSLVYDEDWKSYNA
jgi:hypothetical protein